MVATYVEIIVGIRLTNLEACQILLDMTEEAYNRRKEEIDNDDVFGDIPEREHVHDLPNQIEVFRCGCCSDTTDVVVGISLRKMYRVNIRCNQCKEYSLCDSCFNTTEQGLVNYDETYSFKQTLRPTEVCDNCFSYNKDGKEDLKCAVCRFKLNPLDTQVMAEHIKNTLDIEREVGIYFHWDDCCSCT